MGILSLAVRLLRGSSRTRALPSRATREPGSPAREGTRRRGRRVRLGARFAAREQARARSVPEPVVKFHEIPPEIAKAADLALYEAVRAGKLTAGVYRVQGTDCGCALFHIDRRLGGPEHLPDALRGEILRANDGTIMRLESPHLAYLEVSNILERWRRGFEALETGRS